MSRNYFQHSTNFKTLNGLRGGTSEQRFDTSLLPSVSETYDLGSGTLKWQELYVNKVDALGGESRFTSVDVTDTMRTNDLVVTGTTTYSLLAANDADIAALKVTNVNARTVGGEILVGDDMRLGADEILYTNKIRSNPAGGTVTVYDNLTVLGTLNYTLPPAPSAVFGTLGDTEIGDLVTDPLDASPPEAADSNLQPAAERVLSAPTINATQWISTPFLTLMGLAQTDKLKVTSDKIPTSKTDYNNSAFWNEGGAILQGRTYIDAECIPNSLSVVGNATVGGTFGVTGATTLSSTLGVTGATTFGAAVQVTGAGGLPAQNNTGNAYFVGGQGGGNSGRAIIGDGTGWAYRFAHRTSSTTTDVVTISDQGYVTASNSGTSVTVTPRKRQAADADGWVTLDPNGGDNSVDNTGVYVWGSFDVEGNFKSLKTGPASSVTVGPNTFAGGISVNDTSVMRNLALTNGVDTTLDITVGSKDSTPTAGWITFDPNPGSGGTFFHDAMEVSGTVQANNGVVSTLTGNATSTTSGPNRFAGGLAVNGTSHFTTANVSTLNIGTFQSTSFAAVNNATYTYSTDANLTLPAAWVNPNTTIILTDDFSTGITFTLPTYSAIQSSLSLGSSRANWRLYIVNFSGQRHSVVVNTNSRINWTTDPTVLSPNAQYVVDVIVDGVVASFSFNKVLRESAGNSLLIDSTQAINLGHNATKEINAGRMGYELFGSGYVDIVGAGTTSSGRKVRVFDQLECANFVGTNFVGNVQSDTVSARFYTTQNVTELQYDGTGNFTYDGSAFVPGRILARTGYSGFSTTDTVPTASSIKSAYDALSIPWVALTSYTSYMYTQCSSTSTSLQLVGNTGVTVYPRNNSGTIQPLIGSGCFPVLIQITGVSPPTVRLFFSFVRN